VNISANPAVPAQNYREDAGSQALSNGTQQHQSTVRNSSLRNEAANALNTLMKLGFGNAQLQRELGDDTRSKILFTELVAGVDGSQTVQSVLQGRPDLRSLPDEAGMDLTAHPDSAVHPSAQSVTQQPKDGPVSRAHESTRQNAVSQYQPAPRSTTIPTLIPGLSEETPLQISGPPSSVGDTTSVAPNLPAAGEQLSKEAQRKLFLDRLAAAKSKKTAAGTKSPVSAPTPSSTADIQHVVTTSHPQTATDSLTLSQVPGLSSSMETLAQKSTTAPHEVPKSTVPSIRLTPAELSRRMNAMREQAAQSAKAQARPALPSRSISMSSLDYSQGQDSDASDSIQSISNPSHSESHPTPLAASIQGGSEHQSRGYTQSSIPGISPVESRHPSQASVSSYFSTQYPSMQNNQHVQGSSFQRNPPSQRSQQSPRHYPASKAPTSTVATQQPATPAKRALDPPAHASGVTFRPNKRHFNQHAYENEVIIEISSDEDEDSEMEIDDRDVQPPYSQSISTPHHRPPQRLQATNTLPSKPIFAGRPHQHGYSTPNSGFPTPTAVSTPNSLDIQRQHDALEQKRKELQEQIQKKQQERKLKMGAATSSGQATPIPMKIASPINHADNSIIPGSVESTVSLSLEVSQHAQLSLPSTLSTDKTAMRKAVSPKPKSAEAKRKELNNHNIRLQAMQKQLEEMQAEIAREEATTKALQLELEEHGVDTEGMTVEDMQEIKDDLIQATEGESRQEHPALPDLTAVENVANTHQTINDEDDSEEEGELLEDSEDIPAETGGMNNSSMDHALPDDMSTSSVRMEHVIASSTAQDDLEAQVDNATHIDGIEHVDLISSDSSDSGPDSGSDSYVPGPLAVDEVNTMEVSDADEIDSSSDSSDQLHAEAPVDTYAGVVDDSTDGDTENSDAESDSSAEDSEEEHNMATATRSMTNSPDEESDSDEPSLTTAVYPLIEISDGSEEESEEEHSKTAVTGHSGEITESLGVVSVEDVHKTDTALQPDTGYPSMDGEGEDDLDLSDIYDPPPIMATSFSEQISADAGTSSDLGYGSTDEEDDANESDAIASDHRSNGPNQLTATIVPTSVSGYQALPGIIGSAPLGGIALQEQDAAMQVDKGGLTEQGEAMQLDNELEDGEISEPDSEVQIEKPQEQSTLSPSLLFGAQEDRMVASEYEAEGTRSQADEGMHTLGSWQL
jgi:hypothetical protein